MIVSGRQARGLIFVTNKATPPNTLRELRFPRKTAFSKTLTARINAHFENQSRAGGSAIVRKTGIIVAWLLLSYTYLLFFAQGPLDACLAGLSLSFAIAGVGFSIQHDAGHASYSDKAWVNRLASMSLDFIGGSSWIWKSKHNFLHHYYTNIDGVDADLQDGSYLRLCPSQPRRGVHRFQHLYAWVLYGLLPIKWHLLDDFSDLRNQKIGAQSVRLDDRKEVKFMLIGKAVFFTWALAIPIAVHGWGAALLGYTLVSAGLGVMLAVVFQLAHCVQEASFVDKPEPGEKLPMNWAEHQVRTTINFAPKHPFWTWYLGGLNYQVEHHLFPKVSHIHYPDISAIVKATCIEFDVPYQSHPTVAAAVGSHYRLLRDLGRA